MSGLPMVQMGMGGMKVKNTFLDYDTDGTPLGNRWRILKKGIHVCCEASSYLLSGWAFGCIGR